MKNIICKFRGHKWSYRETYYHILGHGVWDYRCARCHAVNPIQSYPPYTGKLIANSLYGKTLPRDK